MDRIRTLLFAMTGLGNGALRGLLDLASVDLAGVVGPSPEPMPYPYFPCPPIEEEAAKAGVPVFQGLKLSEQESVSRLAALRPDLIVCCTFRQIIGKAIIRLPKLGVVNLHPSLLPRYRGPTPTVWAILAGERETGVTAHLIEDGRIDAGPIVAQRKVAIEDDDTDGALRRKLASLCGQVAAEAVTAVSTSPRGSFPRQDESLSTRQPKRTLDDARLDPSRPIDELRRRILAMEPWPRARLTFGGREHLVASVRLAENGTCDRRPDELLVETPNQRLLFKVRS